MFLFKNVFCSKKSSSNENKIALLVPSLEGGGAQRIIVYLGNALVKRGFSVDILLLRATGPYITLVNNNVRIVDLRCDRALASLSKLIEYIQSENPKVILSTLNHTNVLAILARMLARSDVKIVVRVANNLKDKVNHSQDIREHLMLPAIKFFYPLADKIIAISHGLAEELTDIHKLPLYKVKVIYNPVVTPKLLIQAQEPLEHPWFARGEPPVILGVGRLTAQKDFPTLIRAFANLRQQNAARLVILGEGEDRTKLESLVKELNLEHDVNLPGFVENPFQYMKNASVFVCSSRWEGFGNVLVEAMACGTPVVSTDCPSGPREILEDGKWGKLVPVGNVEALSHSIVTSLNGEIKCPSRKILQNRFGINKIFEEYMTVLAS